MFCYKIHKSEKDVILAVCDAELAGKTLSEGKLRLQVKEQFYCNAQSGEEVVKLFEMATIINLVGEKIVVLAEKKGWLEMKNTIKINGVPHAQIIKI